MTRGGDGRGAGGTLVTHQTALAVVSDWGLCWEGPVGTGVGTDALGRDSCPPTAHQMLALAVSCQHEKIPGPELWFHCPRAGFQ